MNKILSFLKRKGHEFHVFLLGPSVRITEQGKKDPDTNVFNTIISLGLTIIVYLLFRGAAAAGSDFAYLFTRLYSPFQVGGVLMPLFLSIIIAGAVLMVRACNKKHFIGARDAIGFAFFFVLLYITIIFSIHFDMQKETWPIWLVMLIPTIFTLFFLSVYGFRLVYKAFFVKEDEGREEDYIRRTRLQKKIFNRILLWLKKNWGQILLVIALCILAIAVLIPMFTMLTRSFKFNSDELKDPFGIPRRVTFENYAIVWESLKGAFFNSLITTFGVTIGTMILASLLAYAFVRFNFPLKNLLFYLIIGLMMVPGILTLISRYRLILDLGMVGSLWGIILPGMAGYVPASFMLLFTFFKGIPHDLFDAADIDGASDLSVYMHIVLPLSKPILSTIAIQTFVGEWNDYLWAQLVVGSNESKYTLPIFLNAISNEASQTTFQFMSVPFAGYVLSAIPLLLIFIVASKQFIEGLTSGAFKM